MLYKAENSVQIKLANQKYKEKYLSKNSIDKFKSEVRNGPYYICVICNRCLYNRSVKIFHSHKYTMPDISFFYIVHVKCFNDKMYICLTCDKKLIKSEVLLSSSM